MKENRPVILDDKTKPTVVQTVIKDEQWEQKLAKQQENERQEANFFYAEEHKDDEPMSDAEYLVKCMWLPF